jgi:hypothetical protein
LNNVKIGGIYIICEKFEYKRIGNLRFIGVDLQKKAGISYKNTLESRYQDTIKEASALLDPLISEYIFEQIADYCFLEHHHGGEVNVKEAHIIGRFFKADTPVPQGCIYYDVPTENIGIGIYCGDANFSGETFDAYVPTRDRILKDGVEIPYPQAYWTAVQFIGGEPKKGEYRFGYMLGVGEIKNTEDK